jgi:hypothetical protein
MAKGATDFAQQNTEGETISALEAAAPWSRSAPTSERGSFHIVEPASLLPYLLPRAMACRLYPIRS